ncbi:DUF1963 domain-containing protein [Novosphingobium colocasiae]|uniref:DUF1963 domain-containing protein n=1 Tax=Novosphingobium colocasiae TaxID=1256513 RepID=UPI0035B31F28
MRRVPAMVLTFGFAVALTGYVAMAPFAGSPPGSPARPVLLVLDQLAAQLNAVAGRGVAIIALLVIGGILALLLGMTGGAPVPAQRRTGRERAGPAEPAIFRPEPAISPDRIAALRRRAGGEEAAEADEVFVPPAEHEYVTVEPEAPATDPAALLRAVPVVLVRKPRERDRDWTGDLSWLGGLPRLGDASWPQGVHGAPLPFLAQIDLADVAAACPDSPLPAGGSLAFFARLDQDGIADGAVVHVADGVGDFTDPPAGLPPAFDEGGAPFPATPTRGSRAVFPFWPVETVPLALSAHDAAGFAAAMRGALDDAIGHPHAEDFSAQPGGAALEGLWWHSVHHLADRLHDIAAMAEDIVAQGSAPPDELARIEEERVALPPMLAAMDQFVEDRDPWQPLADEELALVEDILTELHASYPALIARTRPNLSLAALATASLRAMITGGPEALAALPEAALERVNSEHALPRGPQHRLFGTGASGDDIVLIQLGRDDLMEWRWREGAAIRFTIALDQARIGNWSAAQAALTDD